MYNVLDKLRAGEALNEDDERIKLEGLVLIMKELHDRLDMLVAEAYGWPADLPDEAILERLVELNKKRSLEEKVGVVKWLRPDYQVPRFGSDAAKARLAAQKAKVREEQRLPLDALAEDEDDAADKPKFPTGNELAETAAIMSALASATSAMSTDQIARSFAQGRQIEKRVSLTISALARLGHIAMVEGEEKFTLRRTA